MELAQAAGFERKRASFAAGERINSTENRPVFHIALRSPRDKAFYVDGVNVVPAVHEVLDRVCQFYFVATLTNSYGACD
jgi:glucose-6-phosphate isomerase